jgi:hypothetical protein
MKSPRAFVFVVLLVFSSILIFQWNKHSIVVKKGNTATQAEHVAAPILNGAPIERVALVQAAPILTRLSLFDKLTAPLKCSSKTSLNAQMIPPPFYGGKMTRPEERGPNFSNMPVTSLLDCMSTSPDKIEKRKAAKVLGDAFLSNKLKLTDAESDRLNLVISSYLDVSAKNPQLWSEAHSQIERLWFLVQPAVLLRLKAGKLDYETFNAAIMLRSESLISEIIGEAKRQQDKRVKLFLTNLLVHMRSSVSTTLPDRKVLSDEQTQILFDRLIVPAIKELRPSFPDERDDYFWPK